MKEYESLTFEQMPTALCRLLQEVSSIKNYLLNRSTLNDSQGFIKPEKEWLTVAQISHKLDLKQSSIYQLIYQKKIPSYKRGGRLYFDAVEIDEWIRSGKKKTLEMIKKEANIEIKR